MKRKRCDIVQFACDLRKADLASCSHMQTELLLIKSDMKRRKPRFS